MHSLLRTVVLNLSAHYNVILLKKYSILPPPQRPNLFSFAINVKQISLHQGTIVKSHLTTRKDVVKSDVVSLQFFLSD